MPSKNNIIKLFDSFNRLKVLVVGDVMVDSYLWGTSDRISPEVPIPIIKLNKRENRLGGAANVAINLKALGVEPFLFSVIGRDRKSEEFMELLKQKDINPLGIIRYEDRRTTCKFRIMSKYNQVLRVDEEVTTDISPSYQEKLLQKIKLILKKEQIDALIFQDYNKGVLTKHLIEELTKIANQYQILLSADPKFRNFMEYKNITLFKSNLKELKASTKINCVAQDLESLKKASNILHKKSNIRHVMTTLSENGICMSSQTNQNKREMINAPTVKLSVKDVSGAGDTVIAIATICLTLHQTPKLVATISNIAGGLVCEESGVVPINKEKLKRKCLNLYS